MACHHKIVLRFLRHRMAIFGFHTIIMVIFGVVLTLSYKSELSSLYTTDLGIAKAVNLGFFVSPLVFLIIPFILIGLKYF